MSADIFFFFFIHRYMPGRAGGGSGEGEGEGHMSADDFFLADDFFFSVWGQVTIAWSGLPGKVGFGVQNIEQTIK